MHNFSPRSPLSLSPFLLNLLLLLTTPLLPLSHAWTTAISMQSYVHIPFTPPFRSGAESLLTSEDDYDDPTSHILRTTLWYDGPFPGFPYNPVGLGDPPPPGGPPAMLFTTLCTNIPPETCCRSVSLAIGFGAFRGSYQATFMNLEHGMITGVWGSGTEDALGACDGEVLDSYLAAGAPRWTWRDPVTPPRITGASYNQCPGPPIVTGVGPLLASLCPAMRMGISSLASSFPKRWRRKAREGGGGDVGGAKWAFPDIVVVNGTNFTDGRRGDLMYRDEMGRVLNLTLLRSRQK